MKNQIILLTEEHEQNQSQIAEMKEKGFYGLVESDIIALEDLQLSLSQEKYQTIRRIELWDYIETLLNAEFVKFENYTDKRTKIVKDWGVSNLVSLGAMCRKDFTKASFLETAYLDIDEHRIVIVDHCVCFNL